MSRRNVHLYEYIGDPINLATAYSTAAYAASAHDGLALNGVDEVLLFLNTGTIGEGTTLTVSLQYSCDSEGSNADAGSDEWHATDAVFANVTTASTGVGYGQCYMLDLNCARKGVNKDRDGYLFASVATLAAATPYSITAVPVYGTGRYPATNANTVVYAYGDPDT